MRVLRGGDHAYTFGDLVAQSLTQLSLLPSRVQKVAGWSPLLGLLVVLAAFVPRRQRPVAVTAITAAALAVVGAVLWIASLVYAGYIFGNIPWVKQNLSLIVIGIVLSLVMLLHRLDHPHSAVLGRSADGTRFADLDENADVAPVPGLLIYRLDAPLIFANAESVLRAIGMRARAGSAHTRMVHSRATCIPSTMTTPWAAS